MRKILNKLRWFIVRSLIGKTPYVRNVTFYQTVCVDIKSGTVFDSATVKLGHTLKWIGEDRRTGFCMNYYEDNLNESKTTN